MLFDYNWNSRIGEPGYEDGSLGRCVVKLVARSCMLPRHRRPLQPPCKIKPLLEAGAGFIRWLNMSRHRRHSRGPSAPFRRGGVGGNVGRAPPLSYGVRAKGIICERRGIAGK